MGLLEIEKPKWFVGSPPCTFFTARNQGINERNLAPERDEALRKEAVKHLHFIAILYKLQLDAGRHFVHEHPTGATSWNDEWIQRLRGHPSADVVTSDLCEYGLLTPESNGIPTNAKKPKRWTSSSPHMLKRRSRRCNGDHNHQHLNGGKAEAAEDYPIEVISDILGACGTQRISKKTGVIIMTRL